LNALKAFSLASTFCQGDQLLDYTFDMFNEGYVMDRQNLLVVGKMRMWS